MDNSITIQEGKTATNTGFGVIGAGRWNIVCSSLSASVPARR